MARALDANGGQSRQAGRRFPPPTPGLDAQGEDAGLPADDEIPGFNNPPKEPTEVEILRSWFDMRIGEVKAAETKDWIRSFLDGKIEGKDSQDIATLINYKDALEKKLADAGGAK